MSAEIICLFFAAAYVFIYAAQKNKNDHSHLIIVANMWLIAAFVLDKLK